MQRLVCVWEKAVGCVHLCLWCLRACVLSVQCRLYCPTVCEMRQNERFTIMKHYAGIFKAHTCARARTHTQKQEIVTYILICSTTPYMHTLLAVSLSEVSFGAYLGQGQALRPVWWQTYISEDGKLISQWPTSQPHTVHTHILSWSPITYEWRNSLLACCFQQSGQLQGQLHTTWI